MLSNGEVAYLIFVAIAFAGFGVSLAYVSWTTRKH